MIPLLTQLHTRIAELVPGKYKTIEEVECPECFTQFYTPRRFHLADILRAMNASNQKYSVCINDSGHFLVPHRNHKDNQLYYADGEPQWNLSKNLDDQSTEVHEFIASIIL